MSYGQYPIVVGGGGGSSVDLSTATGTLAVAHGGTNLTDSGTDSTKALMSDGAHNFVMATPAGGGSLPSASNDHQVLTKISGTAEFQTSTPVGHRTVTFANSPLTLTLDSPSYLHCDLTNGSIVINLPTLSASDPAKTYVIFLTTSAGNNTVSVVAPDSNHNFITGNTTEVLSRSGEVLEVQWRGVAEVTD